MHGQNHIKSAAYYLPIDTV